MMTLLVIFIIQGKHYHQMVTDAYSYLESQILRRKLHIFYFSSFIFIVYFPSFMFQGRQYYDLVTEAYSYLEGQIMQCKYT